MQNKKLKITIFGDICPVDGIKSFNVPIGEDEIVVGNLECALTDNPRPVKKAGPVLYAAEVFAASLKEWGFDAVSLANNHIRDCGDEGVYSTIAACQKNGILSFGAGNTSTEAGKPLIVEKNGKKVAFMSFAEKEFNYVHDGKAGAIAFDPYESFDMIREVRKGVDALIVLYHGGIEHYIYPSPLLRKKCRKMVEAGADVVLCQHSHCIGTRENYGKGEILYGQGNSLFGYRKENNSWNYGLLVRLELSEEGIHVKYDVLETSEDGAVGMASNAVADKVMAQLEKESVKLSNDDFLDASWKVFCRKKAPLYLAMTYGFGTNMNRLNRLLRNGVIKFLFGRRELNVSHNIIRCDAHKEVIETIFEEYEF